MPNGILEQTKGFLAAFNNENVEEILAFFDADGVWSELDGTTHRGTVNIRKALENTLGGLTFEESDTFADLGDGKVLVEWRLRFTHNDQPASFLGLDVLHWRDGKVILKSTYSKARAAKLE